MIKKTVHKAFRFRLKPNDEQTVKLYQMAGCGRVVYNDSLDFLIRILKKETGITEDCKNNIKLYEYLNDLPPKERIALKKKLPREFDLNKLLTGWKKKDHRLWLSDAFNACLQQRNGDLSKAVKDWASGKRGFPKFRTRMLANHSTMRFPDFKKQCVIENRRIKLTTKLGYVGFHKSQEVQGKPKSATVTLDTLGNWHVSVMCEVEIEIPDIVEGEQCGIDMGIAKNITCSTDCCGDNGVFVGVHSYRKNQSQLKKVQRKLSRKIKGSGNWKKQKRKVSKLHQKISNVRNDYIQKVTTEISKNHAIVICEDLKVKNMSKSSKGNIEKPGKMVKQKSGLNKSILDQGWGEIRRQLDYKMTWKGGIFDTVNPRNTSRECCSCRHVSKDNRKTQEHFECVSCGHKMNADKNASIVVLLRYLESLGAGQALTACQVSDAVISPATGSCVFSRENHLNFSESPSL